MSKKYQIVWADLLTGETAYVDAFCFDERPEAEEARDYLQQQIPTKLYKVVEEEEQDAR